MKQRLSALDLQIISKELEDKVVGYRLRNIYNIADSNRQFLLKFGKPDSKLNVVIDCGLRVHITDFTRPTPPTPSWFVSKLRQYLKEKRLTGVRQVPNDRIIVFTFADGRYYLVLEFFSAGNVLLLDADQKIILLQRVVDVYEMKVGQVYNMFDPKELVEAPRPVEKREHSEDELVEWINEAELKAKAMAVPVEGQTRKSKVPGSIPSIQKLLFLHAPHLSSDLIQNVLKLNGINPSESCLHFKSSDSLTAIVNMLNQLESDVSELLSTSASSTRKGYILTHKNKLYDPARDGPELEYTYSNFHPFKPFIEGSSDVNVIEIEGYYNEVVDKFFSTIESNKYANRLQNQDYLAKKKINEAKANNEKIIQSLLDAQKANEEKGNILIANADLVEEAMSAVRSLLEQQMDWKSIDKLIANEQRNKNKIAQLIKLPMDLANNKISLNLPKEPEESKENNNANNAPNLSSDESASDESDLSESDPSDISDISDSSDDEEEAPRIKKISKKHNNKVLEKNSYLTVSVDLSLSAFANASNYFNAKKATSEKQKKVEKNAVKALKSIQQKIEKDLQKKVKDSHDVLKAIRNPYFFEKYYWFISSEGFVVIMGKSPIETDQIYSKYVNDDDILVTNSFDNKAWILNPDKTEVPPNTLMQAGVFVNSASEAWSKKIASSPWWCFAKNVTKFDDIDGGVLPAGSFRMKNPKDKNMLPPAQLVMGLGFIWKVKSEEDEEDEEKSEDNDSSADEEEIPSESTPEVTETDNNSVNDLSEKVEQLGFDVNNFDEIPTKEHLSQSREEVQYANSSDEQPDDTKTIATTIVENMNTKVRGKKGKLKKIQRKYLDQDEEERLARLEALGTLKGIEKERQKKTEELEKAEKREFKKQIRKRQEESRILQFNKSEKVKVNIAHILKQLKGTISQEDEVSDVIPVYAPWSALTKYKYKAKLQPGTAKKTKSINDVLHYFITREVDSGESSKELDWPREHEAIKLIKGLDIVPIICSDKLKVTIPGSNDKSSSSGKGKKASQSNKGKKSKK